MRGPSAVMTARTTAEEDDALPPGAQSADFKTLHAMIARGIQETETGANKLEADIPRTSDLDDEERRFRERQRQHREQEAAQREKERERARQKRRKEEEERQRRQAEELDREEREVLRLREEAARNKAQCSKEMAAAIYIQAHVRGRRSRAGHPSSTPSGIRAMIHTEPWASSAPAANHEVHSRFFPALVHS